MSPTQVRKLLIISNLYPPHVLGGAEVIAAAMAESMVARGTEVCVLTTCSPEAGTALLSDVRNGVTVQRFFPRNLYWVFDRRPDRAAAARAVWHYRDAWNRHAGKVLDGVLTEYRPDVVHTHNIDGVSPIVWAVTRRHGLPLIHTAHDCHLICPRAILLRGDGSVCTRPRLLCRGYRRWYRYQARALDLFCAPSRFNLDCHRNAGFTFRNAAVIPNGIPAAAAAAESHRGAGTELQVLFLGALAPHKGLPVLLEAVTRLPGQARITLHIAGAGPLEQQVRQAAGHDPRIVFHGRVEGEAKSQLLRQADVLVFPSICYENCPLAIIEALAHGVAVIGTTLGGIPELIQEGRTGYLVPPGDAQRLADCLSGLMANPARLAPLRAAARASGMEMTLERMCADYLRRYEELVAGRARLA